MPPAQCIYRGVPAAQGLAQGTISFVPGQSRPVRTIPEEPQGAHEAGSASDGDADDEGAGPSRPAEGPRFKQRTICFGAAAVRLPTGPPAAPPAPAIATLAIGPDTGGGAAQPAAPQVEDTAADAAPAAAAPAKRRRRKRRAAQQEVSDASCEDARDSDREAAGPTTSQPKQDRRQRTMAASFASARARLAKAPGIAARILAGAEGSQANPVDLSGPSPQAVELTCIAVQALAAEPDGYNNAPEHLAADAGPKKRHRRKRSKAEQPDPGPGGELAGEKTELGSAQPRTGPRQRTLTLCFAGVALPPVLGAGLVPDASCAGMGAAAEAPASKSVPCADATGKANPVAAALGLAADEVPAAEKPKKRAYRKRSKTAAEFGEIDAGRVQESQAAPAAAPQPQPDPKQRKLSFTVATPHVPADSVKPEPAKPPIAVQDAGSHGQPSDAHTAVRTDGSPASLSSGASAGGGSCPDGDAFIQSRGCAKQVRAFTDSTLAPMPEEHTVWAYYQHLSYFSM